MMLFPDIFENALFKATAKKVDLSTNSTQTLHSRSQVSNLAPDARNRFYRELFKPT